MSDFVDLLSVFTSGLLVADKCSSWIDSSPDPGDLDRGTLALEQAEELLVKLMARFDNPLAASIDPKKTI